MITLTIIVTILAIFAVIGLFAVLTVGGSLLVLFGDIAVCIAVIWLLVKLFTKKKKD